MNSYDLSREWFDWCFVNPEKVKPVHTALYFFAIEHCNRLGWKDKFGLPSSMAMEAIGIKSYNTYANTFKDIVAFGFFKLIEKSKNQYSSNIIALSNFNKAHDKALDKALIKHTTKQSESTVQSIDSINKQETRNNKQRTKNHIAPPPTFEEFLDYAIEKAQDINIEVDESKIKAKYLAWKENGWKTGKNAKIKNWKTTLLNTLNFLQKEKSSAKKESEGMSAQIVKTVNPYRT
jgi:hypothetical protein